MTTPNLYRSSIASHDSIQHFQKLSSTSWLIRVSRLVSLASGRDSAGFSLQDAYFSLMERPDGVFHAKFGTDCTFVT